MIRVGINGFGRIGKTVAKILMDDPDTEIAGINDLASVETQAHLFKYDSVHGVVSYAVSSKQGKLILKNIEIPYSSESEIGQIPWKDIDILLECTGKFTDRTSVEKHLNNGVPKVILSAPGKSDDIKTVLVGINDSIITAKDRIVSNASCTTNSAGPLVQILDKHCKIESAYITTVHSYTGDQRLHDSPHHDLRRARAAALSIIPTTTGAAKAITRIFTHLEGKIGGCGIRVPVPNGSLTDISCVVENPLGIEDINQLFKEAAKNDMKNILEYTEDPIVSRDIIGNPHSCIFDAQLTSVVGKMVKVVGWYDNESGYANRLRDLVKIVYSA